MNSVLKKLSRALRHAFSTHYAFKRLAKYHSQPRSMEKVVDWAMNFGGGDHTEAGVTADYNDDKDFEQAVRLPQSTVNGSGDAISAVVRRDDNADESRWHERFLLR